MTTNWPKGKGMLTTSWRFKAKDKDNRLTVGAFWGPDDQAQADEIFRSKVLPDAIEVYVFERGLPWLSA